MEFQKHENHYVVRLARGERIVESLVKFVTDEKIQGGFFVGLGAADEVEIAHYSVDNKKYSTKKLNHSLEITNITGNIAYYEQSPLIHCHGTFSDQEMNCWGGHIVEARVSGTLELLITITQKLEKSLDDVTGLKLLDLS